MLGFAAVRPSACVAGLGCSLRVCGLRCSDSCSRCVDVQRGVEMNLCCVDHNFHFAIVVEENALEIARAQHLPRLSKAAYCMSKALSVR